MRREDDLERVADLFLESLAGPFYRNHSKEMADSLDTCLLDVLLRTEEILGRVTEILSPLTA